jgi:Ricin-type beta-trefoil lectin domain
MMLRSGRAVFRATLTGLLAAGAITAGVTAANANTAGFCSSTGTTKAKASCMVTEKITNPATVMLQVTVTQGANQVVSTAWTASCTLGSDTEKNFGGTSGTTPNTEALVLPFPNPDSCTVTASATLSTNDGTMLVTLMYAPSATATPTPTPSSAPTGSARLYRGIGGKCVDDKGNSSADRAKVIIWTCHSNDKAQAWVYSGGKLVHNGKCLNDQRSGGNGSKVILYSCNGGANEIWTHKSNGEFVLKANGGKYCLDDPASSKSNGTQLIVWVCHNATNQHWFAATAG